MLIHQKKCKQTHKEKKRIFGNNMATMEQHDSTQLNLDLLQLVNQNFLVALNASQHQQEEQIYRPRIIIVIKQL